LRPDSNTYKALQLAFQLSDNPGIDKKIIDLRQLELPFCNGKRTYPHYPDVQRLRDEIRNSNGLLLATPEYHGNMSGVLKNALDLLSEEEMGGKVVGLIAILGGVHSSNAINALRLVCRHLHSWVLPEQIIIPHADSAFDPAGWLHDKLIQDRLKIMMEHLAEACKKLRG